METIGFAGLGVMGEPICRNIVTKSGATAQVFDLSPAPMQRLAEYGARPAGSVGELAAEVDILFLSLPGGPQLDAVARGPGGILERGRAGLLVVDMTTAPVGLTREIAGDLAGRGIEWVDAPVARTRAAAEDGTLSIMVGGTDAQFHRVEHWLAHAAEEVTHCGPLGCGQVAKILNNMVLFETVVALSEALALGTSAGMDPELLFRVLSKGSADSFALRNHGMKAMLPGNFPEGAFPTDYALKDVSYALDLAREAGIAAPGAELAKARLDVSKAAGFGAEYFPALAKVTGKG
ncbi:2-hydroxy-3-oxopropionate reductase [Pseudooceanicola nanhaiensis]|jgi:3-hydroxyisobutyrate dehydrogenase-like beta-hydroxyacid dehydrogenase|uniref:2-hydroxy-3-oxopropionate reductase n=1 Tax=Pseudooceanicola nanhaiensis TaxID=375761 RepID=A0A917WER3_9RHOB|nr:NAD(P)-dependent oxidoreductase [Pseudooceanicola nanhaiensis]GGL96218.1 2-hydroxy-3-oxopropionate reductase [Pseudooceanicola nanhaiensis]